VPLATQLLWQEPEQAERKEAGTQGARHETTALGATLAFACQAVAAAAAAVAAALPLQPDEGDAQVVLRQRPSQGPEAAPAPSPTAASTEASAAAPSNKAAAPQVPPSTGPLPVTLALPTVNDTSHGSLGGHAPQGAPLPPGPLSSPAAPASGSGLPRESCPGAAQAGSLVQPESLAASTQACPEIAQLMVYNNGRVGREPMKKTKSHFALPRSLRGVAVL
jgi:hypothetical protein